MNRATIDRVANAVLYEGYILYPYRPSVKNRERWTMGGLYPEAYCRTERGTELSSNQTECLVQGTHETTIEAIVRYLHLTSRQVRCFHTPLAQWSEDESRPSFQVASLEVDNRVYSTWQEAEDEGQSLDEVRLESILERPLRKDFTILSRRWREPLLARDGTIPGLLERNQHEIKGAIELSASSVANGLYRVTTIVQNLTEMEESVARDDALMHSLVSAHILLGLRAGSFISLLDPPEECQEAAAGCRNIGLWPVLVGEEGHTDAMLASPIILYDYPQVAPESPGDLFDATEIDEILTLRVLTLTEEEKRQVAAVDDRARQLLARIEALSVEELNGLHGIMRLLHSGERNG